MKPFKILVAALIMGLMLATPLLALSAHAQGTLRGPPTDQITVEVRTSQETGVYDVINGKIDIFLWSVLPKMIKGLSADQLSKLRLYKTANVYLSLVFNPVENVYVNGKLLPGLVNDTSGVIHFNPFALRKVRFAMNFLLDRKLIVDKILDGGGQPMYTMIQPSSGSYRYIEDLVSQFGFTPEGDKQKASSMAMEAMQNAANVLAQYGYKLELKTDSSGHKWWYFNGQPVTVKFFIRVEDERKDEGIQISKWIEDYFYIKVDQEIRDRKTCIYTVYLTNPADYKWNIYTEGWISMSENPPSEDKWAAAQFYAPWLGWMPGLQVGGWWQYENKTIDEVSMKIIQGRVKSVDEFWKLFKETVKLGVEESVRVGVAEEWQYYLANKARVVQIVPGIITGLSNAWWGRTLVTVDGKAKVAEFSAQGALFMSEWNPVLGFTDEYSMLLWSVIRDYGMYTDPSTGNYIPVRTTYKIAEKKYHLDEKGNIVGDLNVPTTAMIYNSTTKSWENVPKGTKAAVEVIYNYKFSNWHDGHPMTMADVLYEFAFMWEWTKKDGPNDPLYDSHYASQVLPTVETFKGIQVINDTAIAVYGDYVDPVMDSVTAAWYDVWPTIPWQEYEAMVYCIVNKGPETGTKYAWETRESLGLKGIDMIAPDDSKDIAAAYAILYSKRYVPKPLQPYVSPSEAAKGYLAGINFIKNHGHAVISNGPFVLEEYIPAAKRLILKAFRDPTYPFEPNYWLRKLNVAKIRIDSVEAPETIDAGSSIPVTIKMTTVTLYPKHSEEPTQKGYIEVVLKGPKGTIYTAEATMKSPGTWTATIPGDATKGLDGTYTIEIHASLVKGGIPSVSSLSIIIAGVTTTTTTSTTTTTTTTTTKTTTTTAPPPTAPGIYTVTKTATVTHTVAKPTTLTHTAFQTVYKTSTAVIAVFIVVVIIVGFAAFIIGKRTA